MLEDTNEGNGNDKAAALVVWGEREDVKELSQRVRKFMPGGDKMTDKEALVLAQYALTLDANPFRGEVSAWKDWRGQLLVSEGYKLLVRWAKRECDYSERWEPLPNLPEGDIGFRCYILRNDKVGVLADLIKAGVPVEAAQDLALTYADGVVRKDEMFYQAGKKKGQPIDPPKSWTWEQRARIRALKNALRLAYGAPSPREIARESWIVGDTETEPEDWQIIENPAGEDTSIVERTAELSAYTRATLEEFAALPFEEQIDRLKENRELLYGTEGEQEALL